MEDRKIRPVVWVTVLGFLAALVVVAALLESRRASPLREVAKPPTAEPSATPPQFPSMASRSREQRPAPRAGQAVEDPVPWIEGLVYGDIDLREARELMPDNLYWKFGAPTKDPEVLAEREAEQKRRNEEYGRVQAGDASEDEVKAYYEHRRRLSTDYLEFSEFMSRRFRDHDSDQFVGMLELATKLHAERLAQLPAETEEALARSREREKVREDWRRQQEEFGAATDDDAQ